MNGAAETFAERKEPPIRGKTIGGFLRGMQEYCAQEVLNQSAIQTHQVILEELECDQEQVLERLKRSY